MIEHKQKARLHANEIEQRLTRIDIEGLELIEMEFGALKEQQSSTVSLTFSLRPWMKSPMLLS